MKYLILVLILISTTAYSNQCGMKPMVPMNCDDLVCIDGKWRCVSYGK